MTALLIWYQISFSAHHVGMLGFWCCVHLCYPYICSRSSEVGIETHKVGLPALLYAPLGLVILHTYSLMHLLTQDCAILPKLFREKRVVRRCFIPLFHWLRIALAVIYTVASGVGWWCPLQNRVIFFCQMLLIYLWSFSEWFCFFSTVVFCVLKQREGEMVPAWEATSCSRVMVFRVARKGTWLSPKYAMDVQPS